MSDYKITFQELQKLSQVEQSDIYLISIKLENIDDRIKSIINSISDPSWINRLDVIDKTSYEVRAKKTIQHLVNNILKKVEDSVSSNLGEILVSHSAKDVLQNDYNHNPIQLAELWHAKISGNPSFDFHSESPKGLIVFGEGKYQNSSSSSPYSNSAKQICKFIEQQKDLEDLVHIKNFATTGAVEKVLPENGGKKAFAIAFSMNSANYKLIFENALKSRNVKSLLSYPEVYLIGVEI